MIYFFSHSRTPLRQLCYVNFVDSFTTCYLKATLISNRSPDFICNNLLGGEKHSVLSSNHISYIKIIISQIFFFIRKKMEC